MTKRVIISGGGTGGHVFPAIAIGKALQRMQPDIQLLFVGAKNKMEMEKVPQAGFEIKGLNIAGFQRRLSIENLWFPFKLIKSMWDAYRIVKKFKPDVVVGVGGYASGPTLKAASWLGIPTVLQEQNSLPGVTNQLLGKKASVICVAYDKMDTYFERSKIVFTGNPIRENIVNKTISRNEAITHFGFDTSYKTVFITGGSLGARAINNAIAAQIEKLVASNIQVIWQCGKFYINECKEYEIKYPKWVRVFDFIADIDYAYHAADLIVSRAGGTISELAILRKASILLPSPNVAEDHQTKNVMALVESNAAVLIKDTNANEQLVPTIIDVISNTDKCNELANNISKIARPNAANDIANEILKLIS